jgi:hypothetical protein
MANPSTANAARTTAAQVNRDLYELWTRTADAGFQTAFEAQNAALASGQAWLDGATSITQGAYRRWADLTRQAQATALKTYQVTTRFAEATATD